MRKVIIVNFAHPITDEQRGQIKRLMNVDEVDIIGEQAQFDLKRPLRPQVIDLLNRVLTDAPLDGFFEDWVFNMPSLNYAASIMTAEIMRRYDAVPAILRLRAIEGATPPRFEVAEIID